MSYRAKWTIAMTILGLATALVVFMVTDNVGWTLAGLVGSGMVANALVPHRGR